MPLGTTAPPSKDKSSPWYRSEPPDVEKATRELLETYSGVPLDQVIPHILDIRDKAWEVFPYPCIGMLAFLNLSIVHDLPYNEALQRVRDGEQFIDIGCCFGQDIRKFIFDGAPAENVRGFELNKEFTNLGLDLFRDKDRLASNLINGDFFDPESPLKGSEECFDIVHATMFFHLYTWENQVDAVCRAVRLLRRRRGSLVFGMQVGAIESGVWRTAGASGDGAMFRHNEESFREMWREVGDKTGTSWRVEVALEEAEDWKGLSSVVDVENVRRLKFAAWME